MKKVFILLVVLFAFPAFAQKSEEVRWQEVDLRSGEVAEIVISPSNPSVMYAGFEVNSHSLYKSEDAGKSWTRVNGGGDHTKDVAVSPKDANRVYFAMSEALETTDLSITSTAKSLYGGGPSGFGRETQAILSTGIPAGGSSVSFSSVEVFEGDDNIIYAARKGGSMGPFGGVTPKIYKSVNRGQTWSELEPDLRSVNVLAVHPKDSNTILIGSDGVYLSRDSGQTLNLLTKLADTISIEYQIHNPDIIYAASSAKVLKSTDNGENWKEITGSLKDIHRVRVSRSNPNILYASTFNGVFRSDNGGNSWKDVSGNLKSKNIQIVEIHPTNPDIAFVGHSSLWSSVRAEERYRTGLLAHQGIFKTENGGKTWARSDSGINEYQFEEVATHPTKPYEAWILSPASRGGYKTEDGGHNFRLTQTPTFHYPMRVKHSLQDPNRIYATGWQNMAPFSYSSDGGVNWTFVSENVFLNSLERGKHLRTEQARAIHLHGLAVDPKNDQIVYVGSVNDSQNPVSFLKGSHIFKSKDGGKAWIESDGGFPHEEKTAIHDIQISPANSNIIYVATTAHESEKGIGIYKSEDGGSTWRASNIGLSGGALSVGAIAIHPQNTSRLLAATFGGIYKSENAGDSWNRVSASRSFDVEYVIDEPDTVYASTDDGVLVSSDFGSSWSIFGSGLPQKPDNLFDSHFGAGIGVDKTGQVIYAAFQDEGLYVARLEDIRAKEPVSEFGKNPFGFGPFGTGGFGAGGPLEGENPAMFIKILTVLVGIFIALPATIIVVTKILRKRKSYLGERKNEESKQS